MKNYFKKITFILLMPLFLASCFSKVEKRGFMFESVDHHLLQEGITSKDKVLKIMGFPTIISYFNDETWIYYSEDHKKLLFFRPNVVARDVLVLKFDETNVISELKKITLNDEAKDMKFANNFTAVESKKIGVLKSIFSNVGQIKSQ